MAGEGDAPRPEGPRQGPREWWKHGHLLFSRQAAAGTKLKATPFMR